MKNSLKKKERLSTYFRMSVFVCVPRFVVSEVDPSNRYTANG